MFRAVARIATRHPWLVILGWVVVSVLIVVTAPKLSATSDQSEFLPEHYESIKAATLQQKAFPTAERAGARSCLRPHGRQVAHRRPTAPR